MNINNPCIHSDNTAWCKQKKVKRSLFGIGARVCTDFPYMNRECPYFEMRPKPKLIPPKGGSGLFHRPLEIKITLDDKIKSARRSV